MITHSGQKVFPREHRNFDPTGVPTLSDIAIGLSRQSRFGGQTVELYTVLAHSLVVAQLVELHGGTPEEIRSALLHDAPEAVMADVPTTWKTRERNVMEDELYAQIALHHDAPVEIPEIVHEADLSALRAEAHLLGHHAANTLWPTSGLVGMDVDAMKATSFMLLQGAHMEMLLDPEHAIDVYAGAFERTRR
jgi:hypothetical protein